MGKCILGGDIKKVPFVYCCIDICNVLQMKPTSARLYGGNRRKDSAFKRTPNRYCYYTSHFPEITKFYIIII